MVASTVHVVARIRARVNRVEELRQALLALVEPTRAESGCRTYRLLQSRSDPTDFTFVEEWSGDAAIDAHMGTAHIARVLARAEDLLAEPPFIGRYDLLA